MQFERFYSLNDSVVVVGSFPHLMSSSWGIDMSVSQLMYGARGR